MRPQYEGLIHEKQYDEATSSSTAAEESVAARLSLATAAFKNVK
jgi:hypothetical protein